jgi:hypothetical protein
MTQGRYIEAEQSFRDALVPAEIWPGKDNSAYAELWTGLSVAQMKQEHWADAEASAAKSAAICQGRIDDYNKVIGNVAGADADNMRKAIQGEQRGLSTALVELAYVYSRDGNLDQATKTFEQAYQDAVAGKLPDEYLRQIVALAGHIAELTGNADEIAKWAARADTSPQPPPTTNTEK